MPVDSSWLRQGAVNVKQGSTDIVGVGTLWKGQITAGDLFLGPDGAWYEVAAAAADTSLQLRTSYTGATAGNQPYAVVRNFTAQPWSDTASRLSEMVLLWRMTLKGFNDVLCSDAPTVTLYDEAGAGFPVMSWKGADKAIKDAMASIETARKVVVDGSADLLAYRDAASASAKAAKTSQDASGVSAAAAANSLAAVRLSESNVAASLATVRDLQGKAQASQAAADASAKAAASSQAAAAASEAKLKDASAAVEAAKQIATTKADKATTLAGYGITDAAGKAELRDWQVLQKRRGRLHADDGTSLDQVISGEMGFNYGTSSGVYGPYLSFGGLGIDSGYNCQLNADYQAGVVLKFRTRNTDANRWNEWRSIWHSGNLNPVTTDTEQTITAIKTHTARIASSPPGDGWGTWTGDRWPSLQVNCPDTARAYMVWRATEWGNRHLAAMDVHGGGGANTAPYVSLHIAGLYNAHVWQRGDYAAAGTISTGQLNSAMAYNDGSCSLQVRNEQGGAGNDAVAAIAFHCQGNFATKLALRHDGIIGIGGWSTTPWRWYVDARNGNMVAAGVVNVGFFTRATLPAASSTPSGIAYISDGPNGPTHVFSNGQKWRVPALTDL
ncbi:hypothetical protein JFK97_10995 [Chromobacterium phragmitis]|uniref:hypothetical protein n=1 Tax=Chromobacterium amazonense TaxID=1382803 RepID=UPI0021B826D1|nr:hypothetical protein [Chromobacterium amazonense]MBM2884914.1 hypothetical protein [Chromobacterium amazonense]MDE1714739.1 hypothetical protein [Chromobacterium amazonense]